MAQEIERKFTVISDEWRTVVSSSERYRQGYLAGNERASVRVRIAGKSANINIKSATLGIFRREYEYEIDVADADEMLTHLCENPLIEKTRHFVVHAGMTWEIDEFTGDNAGLIVAEIELNALDEKFELPTWVGEDVSHDTRYYNVSLVRHPYSQWKDAK